LLCHPATRHRCPIKSVPFNVPSLPVNPAVVVKWLAYTVSKPHASSSTAATVPKPPRPPVFWPEMSRFPFATGREMREIFTPCVKITHKRQPARSHCGMVGARCPRIQNRGFAIIATITGFSPSPPRFSGGEGRGEVVLLKLMNGGSARIRPRMVGAIFLAVLPRRHASTFMDAIRALVN